MPEKRLGMRCKFHRVKRVNIGSEKDYFVFQCEDCTYYISAKLAKGKSFRCWDCQQVFQIHPLNFQRKNARCLTCMKQTAKPSEMDDVIAKALEALNETSRPS